MKRLSIVVGLFLCLALCVPKGGGQSTFVKVNDLFTVWYCAVDPETHACEAGTSEELSVFDNIFESYFWNILNDGTRLVQVRLYPRQ